MFRAAGVEPGREGDEMVRQVQLLGSLAQQQVSHCLILVDKKIISLPWLQCSHVIGFILDSRI